MSAVEVITEIKKLPRLQRNRVLRFVTDELRREEERVDNELAEKALREPGKNISWSEARERLGWK